MPSLRPARAFAIGLAVDVLGVWVPVAVHHRSTGRGQNRLLDCRSRCSSTTMPGWQEAADRAAESLQGLLLRYRGRSGLTQRELAARVGVSTRTVENWEAGVNYPSAQPLQ